MEIVVSLAVISILIGSVTPLVFRVNESIEITLTNKRMAEAQQGMLEYYKDFGSFPPNLQSLVFSATAGWQGPYVSTSVQELVNDSWGMPYTYQIATPGQISNLTIATGMNVAVLGSGGPNKVLAPATKTGTTWTLNAANDDIVSVTSPYLTRRAYVQETMQRISMVMRLATTGNENFIDAYKKLVVDGVLPDASIAYIPPGFTVSSCQPATNPGIRRDCPIRLLEALGTISTFHSKDQWGSYFRWHPTTKEFYSMGPNRTDESTGTTIVGDDIAGRYYN